MSGIGLLIREIDVNISEIWESKHNFILLLLSKTSARVLSVKADIPTRRTVGIA